MVIPFEFRKRKNGYPTRDPKKPLATTIALRSSKMRAPQEFNAKETPAGAKPQMATPAQLLAELRPVRWPPSRRKRYLVPPPPPEKPHQRVWLHFSLRTVFVLLTLIAVLFAWINVQLNWLNERREALNWLKRQPIEHFKGNEVRVFAGIQPWLLRFVNEPDIDVIVIPYSDSPQADRERLQEFRKLFPEAEIHLIEYAKIPPVSPRRPTVKWVR